jgi:hypothetical protein
MVRRAMNDDVDVVQVFGGASRFAFVVEAIQAAVGEDVDIKKELPATDSLALGGIYVVQELQNMSVYQPPNFTHTAPYNLYVQCGRRIEDYCVKGRRCEEGALFEKAFCDDVFFRTAAEDAPEGCSDVLGWWKLLNTTSFYRKGKSVGGFLLFKQPYPVLEAAMWCKTRDMDCDTVKIEQVGGTPTRSGRIRNFVDAVARGEKEQERARSVRMRILDLIDRISDFLSAKDDRIGGEAREEAERQVDLSKELLKASASTAQLEVVAGDLEAEARFLHLEL